MSKLRSSLLAFSILAGASAAVASPAVPVVGGKPVAAGVYPDVVAVLAHDGACTGTLVAPDVVLTAGHCTTEITPEYVVVDTVDYGREGGEVIPVKQAIGYPDWEHAYDVGAVVLAHPAKAKPRAVARACNAPVAPASGGLPKVTVAGFGLTTKAGTGDNSKLNAAALRVTDPDCTQTFGCNAAIAPDGEFAAGGGGTDSCFGDSGGPAFVDVGGGAQALFGVVSRGVYSQHNDPCGTGGIYVRADKVVAWVEKTTGRKLTRASCAGDAKADDVADDAADGAGGCSAGGAEALLGTVALLPGFVWRRRKRK